MKVKKEIFDLSEKILDTFDPERLKQVEMDKARAEKVKAQEGKNKWENIEKTMDAEEKEQTIKDKNFDKES